MAHCPRRSSHMNHPSAGDKDFTVLHVTSEVLRLCLQALNLPITGSWGQLLACLKRVLPGRVITLSNPQKRRTTLRTKHAKGDPQKRLRQIEQRENLQASQPRRPMKTKTAPSQATPHFLLSRRWFNPVQSRLLNLLATDRSVQSSSTFSYRGSRVWISSLSFVHISNFVHRHLPSSANQSCCTPVMASPLGLSRPLYKSLEDKILGWVSWFCYFCRTTCISSRPLKPSCAWMTHPQAPWVLWSPWCERNNLSLTHSRSGWVHIWLTWYNPCLPTHVGRLSS